jgi:gamma-glutamylcyclotransferase (GGCT)/AIG2-like uncharacterized protein YtfP
MTPSPISPHIVQLSNRMALHKRHTPDIPELEKIDKHIVFVYDGMMNYYLRHTILSLNKSTYIGKYQTNDMHFVMLLYNRVYRQNYPVVLREKSKHARCIYGEAYAITPKTLMLIDKMNDNLVQCKREREQIYAVGDVTRKKHWAWMYIGKEDYWEPEMTNNAGNFTPAFVHNFSQFNTSFYRFFPSDQSRDLFPKHVG